MAVTLSPAPKGTREGSHTFALNDNFETTVPPYPTFSRAATPLNMRPSDSNWIPPMPRFKRTIFVSCTGYPPHTIEEVLGLFFRHTWWCDLLLQLCKPRSRVLRLGTGAIKAQKSFKPRDAGLVHLCPF